MTDHPRPDFPGDGDEAVARIADALRTLPRVDAEARARVLIAVSAERARPRQVAEVRPTWRRVGGLVAAAASLLLVATWATGVEWSDSPAPSVAATASPAAVSAPVEPVTAVLAAGDAEAAASAPQPVQLVVRAPAARTVSVVGDFTGWDAARVPMVRDAASGLWSATVMVRPGRHVYAYVLDDTVWMRDPRAPVATDPDFGRPGSLLLVGRP